MFKIKYTFIRDPLKYVGVRYMYGNYKTSYRTIIKYDKGDGIQEEKFWTNFETYLPVKTFFDMLTTKEITLLSDV